MYQVSGNLILPGEPLAIGYFVAPSKDSKQEVRIKVGIWKPSQSENISVTLSKHIYLSVLTSRK